MRTKDFRVHGFGLREDISVEKRSASGCVVSIEFEGPDNQLAADEVERVVQTAKAEFLDRFPAARPTRRKQPDDGAVYYSWAYRDI